MNNQRVGDLYQHKNGNLSFEYDSNYALSENAAPISLSMPVAHLKHNGKPISNYLWGLLPDNVKTLQSWGRMFDVNHRNAFALLENMGEDCAGAVQFVRENRLYSREENKIQWLSSAEFELRLKDICNQETPGRRIDDIGQFSLAGAQTKIALLYADGKWGIPQGKIRTSHILKPNNPEFDGLVENENFCMELASLAGLSTAQSRIQYFDERAVIIVKRYDRRQSSDENGVVSVKAIHQEDCCQALGFHPDKKYQRDGGPGIKEIMALLNGSSSAQADRERFMKAVVYNFLIGGTDAHAKNFSLIIGLQGDYRLAPLYDVASGLPYFDSKGIRSSMKIGDKDRTAYIMLRHWERTAKVCRYSTDAIINHIKEMAGALPDLASAALQTCRSNGNRHKTLETLRTKIATRCESYLKGSFRTQ